MIKARSKGTGCRRYNVCILSPWSVQMAVRGLAEVVLMVEDIERSVQFYRDVLGCKVISPAQMQAPVFLQVGDDRHGVPMQIVLGRRPPDAPPLPSDRRHRS